MFSGRKTVGTYFVNLLVPCHTIGRRAPDTVRHRIGINATTPFAVGFSTFDDNFVAALLGALVCCVRVGEFVDIVLG